MKKAINGLIILGTVSFIAGIIQRVFYIESPLLLIPTSFIKFSVVTLLLAIALSVKK